DFALPLPEERGLAVTRIGGDDDCPARRHAVQPVEQAPTAEGGGHVVRRRDLVVDQRIDVLDFRQSTTHPTVAGDYDPADYRPLITGCLAFARGFLSVLIRSA